MIEDPDWQIRHRVAQSLAQLGGSEAKSALQKLSNDPISQVAEATRSFLR
jgi:carbon monoxide dehydrogenase subunit G